MATVLGKLEAALPALVVPYVRRAAAERAQSVVAPASGRADILRLLDRALLERRKLRVTYKTASRGMRQSDRVLAPYRLVPYEHSWQVIAHDSDHDSVRMFKVDRIARALLTDASYEVPPDFDIGNYLGPTWGVLRGEGDAAQGVVLRFSAQAAEWVRDERWHPTQVARDLPGGGLELRFNCTITHELVRWLLSFGPEVRIEAPATVRETVAAEARRIVALAALHQSVAAPSGGSET